MEQLSSKGTPKISTTVKPTTVTMPFLTSTLENLGYPAYQTTPENKKRKTRDEPADEVSPYKFIVVVKDDKLEKVPSQLSPPKEVVNSPPKVKLPTKVSVKQRRPKILNPLFKPTKKTNGQHQTVGPKTASLIPGASPSFRNGSPTRTTTSQRATPPPNPPPTNNSPNNYSQSRKQGRNEEDDENPKDSRDLKKVFGECPSETLVTNDTIEQIVDYFVHANTGSFQALIRKMNEGDNHLFIDIVRRCFLKRFQEYIMKVKTDSENGENPVEFLKRLRSNETRNILNAYNSKVQVKKCYVKYLQLLAKRFDELNAKIMAETFVPAFRISCAESFDRVSQETNIQFDTKNGSVKKNTIFVKKLKKDQTWKESLKKNLSECVDEIFDMFLKSCLKDEDDFRKQLKELINQLYL